MLPRTSPGFLVASAPATVVNVYVYGIRVHLHRHSIDAKDSKEEKRVKHLLVFT